MTCLRLLGILAAEATSVPVRSGARRQQVELYFASVDPAEPSDARRLLDVFENVLVRTRTANPDYADTLETWLVKDGYVFEKNRIRAHGATVAKHLAAKLDAVSAQRIHDDMRRIEEATDGDPALSIGAAKELIERVCKTILDAKGVQAKDSDLSVLVKAATSILQLAPDGIPEAAKGSEAVKRTRHNLAAVV